MKYFQIACTFLCLSFSNFLFARHEKTELLFIENKGQVADLFGKPNPEILFTANSKGLKMFFEANKIYYQFEKNNIAETNSAPGFNIGSPLQKSNQKSEIFRLDMELIGANPHPVILTEGKSDYYENFYLAHCPKGITGVRGFTKIIYKNVYPGIDWEIYRKGEFMEYDFIVHPGANPNQIHIAYPNAKEVNLVDGAAHIVTQLGQVIEAAPISYLLEGKTTIQSKFQSNNKSLHFSLENYDASKTLIIDPVLLWSTYFGGPSDDYAYSSTVEMNGNLFMVGKTQSSTGIAASGFQTIYGGLTDALITSFSNSGTRLWSTYYGGSDEDIAFTCQATMNGGVFVGGLTSSTTGIAILGSLQPNFGGGVFDGFVGRLDGAGNFEWRTYYGGTGEDAVYGMSSDINDNLYITGTSTSSDNIATSGVGINSINQGGYTAFLAKFGQFGVRVYGTYFGDGGDERAYGCAVDNLGNPYIAGYIYGSSFMGIGGFQSSPGGSFDGFLVKFNPTGQILWATYYGGIDSDVGLACAVDNQNNVYFGGRTSTSSGSIIASGGSQNNYLGGVSDGFLVKFNENGARLWGTYVGNASEDLVQGITVDNGNIVSVCGTTFGSGNIALNAFQSNYGGGMSDGFVMSYGSNGVHFFGSYLGGSADEYANGITSDSDNNLVVCGETTSTNFPIAGNSFQSTSGGNTDGFISIIENPCVAIVAQFNYSGSAYACALNPLTLNAVTGSGFNYQWLKNGNPIAGATQASYQVTSGGNYALQVNQSGNCTTTSSNVFVDSLPPPVNICLVTVDSLSKFNQLIWEKPATSAIDSFRIYREDITNVYSYVRSVGYNAYSVFIDSNLLYANPNVSSKFYKISTVDACGNESAKSPFHHSIKLNDQANGNFDWNFYEVQGQITPVLQYWLLRDSMSLGIWTPIAIVSGNINQVSDPDYSIYPNSRYRIVTNMGGLSCNPTQRVLAGFNTTRSNIKNKNISSSIKDVGTSEIFSISPNPTLEFLNLNMFKKDMKIDFISIHDLSGRLVKSFTNPESKGSTILLDVTDLAPSVYSIQLHSNNSIYTRKLIKY